MTVTLLTIGAGPVGAAGANKMATVCKTDYCAYDHAGNIIGVLRDAVITATNSWMKSSQRASEWPAAAQRNS